MKLNLKILCKASTSRNEELNDITFQSWKERVSSQYPSVQFSEDSTGADYKIDADNYGSFDFYEEESGDEGLGTSRWTYTYTSSRKATLEFSPERLENLAKELREFRSYFSTLNTDEHSPVIRRILNNCSWMGSRTDLEKTPGTYS